MMAFDLRSTCCHGSRNDTIARISSSSNFNLRSVIVTRESLWRIAGYGETEWDRYLDDQACSADLHWA